MNNSKPAEAHCNAKVARSLSLLSPVLGSKLLGESNLHSLSTARKTFHSALQRPRIPMKQQNSSLFGGGVTLLLGMKTTQSLTTALSSVGKHKVRYLYSSSTQAMSGLACTHWIHSVYECAYSLYTKGFQNSILLFTALYPIIWHYVCSVLTNLKV